MSPIYGKPFNPRRPFGTCSGDDRFHFEQDGQVYDVNKMPVDHLTGEPMPLPPDYKAPVADAAPAAPAPVVADNPEDDVPADEKPFDLLAWAQGEPSLSKTPWEKVKAETASLVDDMTGITGKEAARKAILAHYGL